MAGMNVLYIYNSISVHSQQSNAVWIKPDSYAVNVLKIISSVCLLYHMSLLAFFVCDTMTCHTLL